MKCFEISLEDSGIHEPVFETVYAHDMGEAEGDAKTLLHEMVRCGRLHSRHAYIGRIREVT
jgi:hypothetical protein